MTRVIKTSSNQKLSSEVHNSPVMPIVISVAMAIFGIAFFWDSFSLPDPKFDPVGPAGLPKIASIVLVVLCVFAASFEFLRLRFLIVNQMPYGLRIKGRVRTTVFFFLLAIAYISTLTWLPFGFAIPTTIFVYIAGLVLAPKNKYTVFGLAILAFAIGFGSDYIFSTLLNLVLPGTA
jgi:putative tricarboxylic transport membrane protein